MKKCRVFAILLALLLPVLCVTAMADAPSDGVYTCAVTLTGGTGRATVQSPAELRVENGVITAKIGTKEGLRGGEQFALVDDYGTFYGYVVAQPGMVWDNDNDDIGADAQQCYEPQVDKKGNLVTSTTFKGKVPKNIYSGLLLTNPMPPKKHRIAARIGTKEGVEEGDSYAVYQYDAAADKLIKKGVVRVSKGHVWDNMFYNSRQGSAAASSEELKKRDKDGLRVTETVFTGSCNVQPGMFLRKAR